jgi:hypothetical protein
VVDQLTTRIGILAYGSLINDPRWELRAATTGITLDVLTPFRIEFARSSGSRGGAPTLAPVDSGGAKVKAIIYAVGLDEGSAADVLYRREINEVGSVRKYKPPPPHKANAVRIERLSNFHGYDVVLSTWINANIDPLTAEHLADLAIQSARKLKNGRDGISYLIAARENEIKTPLSSRYEADILKKMGAVDLRDAVARVQAGN